MNVQVAYHLIAVTAANYLDDVTIDAVIEEGHGACSTEGSSRDFLEFKAQV